jgi:CRISPR-associated protein (TIGR02710 family)
MTVGAGFPDQIEKSLLAPLLMSIDHGNWRRVVLFPSVETIVHAKAIRDRRPNLDFDIEPFEQPRTENDVDACFEHFDKVIAALLKGGATPHEIAADFTRGTKAMSAALTMAAVRRGIRQLRYIEGERERGTVKPGSEKLRDFYPLKVIAGRRLDAGLMLVKKGSFAAAAELLNEGILGEERWDEDLRRKAEAARELARFLAAWDRLDYDRAHTLLDSTRTLDLPSDWAALVPPDKVAAWIDNLSAPEKRKDLQFMADHCRRLAVDLAANAERCVEAHRFEDALVRAYRVSEILGQAALFAQGYDSEHVKLDDPRMTEFRKELKRSKSNLPSPNSKDPTACSLAKEQVARFLKHLGDKVGKQLIEFSKDGRPGEMLKKRNNSILIHGFSARGPKDRGDAKRLVEGLEKLLHQVLGADRARAELDLARWPGRLGGGE